jgi:methionyl-tRNA formyltransferase
MRILFLGYSRQQTRLHNVIARLGADVDWTDQRIESFWDYDLVISFGYRHILKASVLATAKRAVLNLHIAYLPWNRGAHPLFWAAYDGTPLGVTIHEIDPGVDTGPICFQRKIDIDYQSETFASGYKKLVGDIETLFEEHAAELLSGEYCSVPQQGSGTVKRVCDLPAGFNWTDTIAPTIQRLKQVAHA